MKRVFETAECEEVTNSIFWEQRYEKHENQRKGCAMQLKVNKADECVDLVGLRYCKSSAR